MQIIDIVPGGDVCLVTTDEDGNEIGYVVHSQTLSLASPFFKTLFGPHFAEGNALKQHSGVTSNPLNIALQDDDAKAMNLLLGHLHFRPLPDRLTREDLIDLAPLVDKYQCQPAFVHYTTEQMRRLLDSRGFSDHLPDFLGLSIAFKSHVIFHAVSMGLALTSTAQGPSSVAARVAASSTAWLIPQSIIDATEDLRKKYQTHIIDRIPKCLDHLRAEETIAPNTPHRHLEKTRPFYFSTLHALGLTDGLRYTSPLARLHILCALARRMKADNATSSHFDCMVCTFIDKIEINLHGEVISLLCAEEGLCLSCSLPTSLQRCDLYHFEMGDDPQGGGYPAAVNLLFGDRLGLMFLTDQNDDVVSFEDSVARGLDGSWQ